MKILLVTDLNPHGRSYQRKMAIEDLGHSVTALLSVPESMDLHDKGSLPARLFCKMGLPLDLTGMNRAILREVKRSEPDVLWIDKGNAIWPRTLLKVKQLSPQTKLVSLSEDDMFASHNRSLFYKRGLQYYDFIFTTKSFNCNRNELPSMGAKQIIFVENSYDPKVHRPVPVSSTEVRSLGAKVAFIGSFEGDRGEKLLYVAERGVAIRVWGTGWYWWKDKHKNLRIENRPLYGDDYPKAICATQINLCFLRKMNRDLQTSRSVEIPACGGFMLAERTEEHRRLFAEGKEAAYFDSAAELLEKIHYYLAHPEQRARIGAAARRRCLVGGYSHHQRLERLISIIAGRS